MATPTDKLYSLFKDAYRFVRCSVLRSLYCMAARQTSANIKYQLSNTYKMAEFAYTRFGSSRSLTKSRYNYSREFVRFGIDGAVEQCYSLP